MERKNINEIKHNYPFDNGSESYVYRLNDKIYKEFLVETKKACLIRKERKLEKLEEIDEIKAYYPKINYIVMSILNEYMRGYVMDKVIGKYPRCEYFSLAEKQNILRNMKEILQLFLNNRIYYFDIRMPNIIITPNNDVAFLDMDNILIDGYDIDIIPTQLKKYLLNGGKLDDHALIASFNLFTKDFLKYEYIHFEKEGEEILENLTERKPDTIFDHEYLFEYIKKS